MFDNLKNLYLLIEIILKRNIQKNTLPPDKQLLGSLVLNIVCAQSWIDSSKYQKKKKLTHFNKPNAPELIQFKNNFKKLMIRRKYHDEKAFTTSLFLLSVLMRNYTSHFFDQYKFILRQTRYRALFNYAIMALLYSLSI
jgi:hypothetical protein